MDEHCKQVAYEDCYIPFLRYKLSKISFSSVNAAQSQASSGYICPTDEELLMQMVCVTYSHVLKVICSENFS